MVVPLFGVRVAVVAAIGDFQMWVGLASVISLGPVAWWAAAMMDTDVEGVG